MKRIGLTQEADGSLDVVIPASMVAEFKTMVRRATNCWQEQSVEMRDFTDRLMERQDIVGSCMKTELYGHTLHGHKPQRKPELEVKHGLATRSCCGTLLREPHHSQCQEVTGKKDK